MTSTAITVKEMEQVNVTTVIAIRDTALTATTEPVEVILFRSLSMAFIAQP